MTSPDRSALRAESIRAVMSSGILCDRAPSGWDQWDAVEQEHYILAGQPNTEFQMCYVHKTAWNDESDCCPFAERLADAAAAPYVAALAAAYRVWPDFTGSIGFGDNITEPAATPAQFREVWDQISNEADEHRECPAWCALCDERLANTSCSHCNGSGCGPGTASGAYQECEWCAGVGKVHDGCAEKSYADLVAALAAAERDLAERPFTGRQYYIRESLRKDRAEAERDALAARLARVEAACDDPDADDFDSGGDTSFVSVDTLRLILADPATPTAGSDA